MPQDHVRVRDPGSAQPEGGPEGEVVDDDRVRVDGLDDVHGPATGLDRLPQEVVAAQLGLEPEGRDGTFPGRGEEGSQVGVLAAGLLVGPGRPGVRAATQDQLDPLEARPLDMAGDTGPGRHRPPAPRASAQGPGQGEEREEMRGVVRADDQEGHVAASTRDGRAASYTGTSAPAIARTV